MWLGRLTDALTLVDEAIELCGGDLDVGWRIYGGRSPYITTLAIRASILSPMGHLAEAESVAEHALDLARTRGEREPTVVALVALCQVASSRGEAEQAMVHARHAFELSEQSDVLSRGGALQALGGAHISSGSPETALATLEGALATMREQATGLNAEGQVLVLLAEADRARGELARGRAWAEEAIAVSRWRKTRVFEAEAHLALARVLLAAEGARDVGAIRDALAQAEALVGETGARVLQPFIHVERAALARLTRDEAARERELRAAQRLFTEMGAPIRAEQVPKELGG